MNKKPNQNHNIKNVDNSRQFETNLIDYYSEIKRVSVHMQLICGNVVYEIVVKIDFGINTHLNRSSNSQLCSLMWEKVTEYLTKWPFLGDFATPNSTQSRGVRGWYIAGNFRKGPYRACPTKKSTPGDLEHLRSAGNARNLVWALLRVFWRVVILGHIQAIKKTCHRGTRVGPPYQEFEYGPKLGIQPEKCGPTPLQIRFWPDPNPPDFPKIPEKPLSWANT